MTKETFLFIGMILGGLSLFLYGISLMSEGLKNLAGEKIRYYIEKYTSTLFMSILVGTILTAFLNSSTAVTVISISLVRAGLMKLEQAIGITIGANIGTTLTSIMIGLNIEEYAFYIVFIGLIIPLLSKKKSISYLGQTLLGFGLLFVGLDIMGEQLIVLASQSWFEQFMLISSSNDWVALLGGTVATAIIQSSTALIAIVQKLYSVDAFGPTAAIAFVYGSNVGTTLTALLAGAGGSVSTKRAAYFHAIYNILGALLGMVFIKQFYNASMYINNYLDGSPEMFVAMAHLIFNILSTLLVFPFVKQFVKLLEFIIPGKDREKNAIETLKEMNIDLIYNFTDSAIKVAEDNVAIMANVAITNINNSFAYLMSKNQEDYDEVMEVEAIVNKYDTEILSYLLSIAQKPGLTERQTNMYNEYFQAVKNYERISDLSTNLVEYYNLIFSEGGDFSSEAREDLEQMYQLVNKMLAMSLEIFITSSPNKYNLLKEKEVLLDELELTCRKKHLSRLKNNQCTDAIASSVYVDILSNIERAGDHAMNVARDVISPIKYHIDE